MGLRGDWLWHKQIQIVIVNCQYEINGVSLFIYAHIVNKIFQTVMRDIEKTECK